MESPLHHPDMTNKPNSIREEEEEEEEEDWRKDYETCPEERLPVEPLKVMVVNIVIFSNLSTIKFNIFIIFIEIFKEEKKVERNSSFKSTYTYEPRPRTGSNEGKRVIVMKAESGGRGGGRGGGGGGGGGG